MLIESFLLCDAATDQSGKLYILGAFDALTSKGLPFSKPQSAISLRVRFEKKEEGKHTIEFKIVSPSQKTVLDSNGEINVQLNQKYDTGTVNFIMSILGLNIEEEGKHKIFALIDGKEVRHTILYVNITEA